MIAPRLFVAPPDLRLPWCFVAPILFWSCQSQPCASTQQQNLTLTRTLHRYLNRGNWLALEGQFADRVSYRLDSVTIQTITDPVPVYSPLPALGAARPKGGFQHCTDVWGR